MPRVYFQNDDLEIEVPERVSLPQAAQEAGATLPFGCRAGTCGACVLHVVEGLDGVESKGFVEEDTLQVLGFNGPGRRLGCQIILQQNDIKVRW